MSNISSVIARLLAERQDGTAAKDLEAWTREAAITMERLQDTHRLAILTMTQARNYIDGAFPEDAVKPHVLANLATTMRMLGVANEY